MYAGIISPNRSLTGARGGKHPYSPRGRGRVFKASLALFYRERRPISAGRVAVTSENLSRTQIPFSVMGDERVQDHAPSDCIIVQRIDLTVWFTGLSGSGKTTICRSVYTELLARGIRAEFIDADEMRKHFNSDLGFSKQDRDENVRRIAFVAGLLTRNGIVVLVAAISPYRSTREEVRRTIGNFIEVYVDASLSVCEHRDPKGLYSNIWLGSLSSAISKSRASPTSTNVNQRLLISRIVPPQISM